MRKIIPGTAISAAVTNQALEDLLTQSGYLIDGSDFAGFLPLNPFQALINRIANFDPKKWGAIGNGVHDDTLNIRNCVASIASNGGGALYLSAPPVKYLITDTISIPQGVSIIGDGKFVSRVDGTIPTGAGKPAFSIDGSNFTTLGGSFFKSFGVDGVHAGGTSIDANIAGNVPMSRGCGLSLHYNSYFLVEDYDCYGCIANIIVSFCASGTILNSHGREARQAGLWIAGDCNGIEVIGSLFQVTNPFGNNQPTGRRPANIKITNNDENPANGLNNRPKNIHITGLLIDELGLGDQAGGACLDIRNVEGLSMNRGLCYVPGTQVVGGDPYYGIRVGEFAQGVKIRDVDVKPYVLGDPQRVPNATIYIDAAARGTLLEEVTTNPNGGADIIDLAPDTEWRRVNGKNKSRQAIVYAASIAPDTKSGSTVAVATLTGNLLVNAPLNPSIGHSFKFLFEQNGVGGWAVTWNAIFDVSWSNIGNGPNTHASIIVEYDGVKWRQVGAQRAWA